MLNDLIFSKPFTKLELLFRFAFMYLFLVFDFFFIFLVVESYLGINSSWIFISSFIIDILYVFVLYLRMD
jgi:hypothetical protein